MENKLCFVYHYFEKDRIYKDNLLYFLSKAQLQENNYIFVVSGSCTVDIPKLENIKIIYRKNENFDFGGYIEALNTYPVLLLDMDYVFFINNSTRGPFTTNNIWYDKFIDKFQEDIHLVGSSINVLHNDSFYVKLYNSKYNHRKVIPHVQTTAYAINKFGLSFLKKIKFFECDMSLSKVDVIINYELRLSTLFLEAGFNIGCILKKYELDFRNIDADPNYSSKEGDPLYKDSYFGKTLTPYELIFVKINRDLIRPIALYKVTKISLFGLFKESINVNHLKLELENRLLFSMISTIIKESIIKLKILIHRLLSKLKINI